MREEASAPAASFVVPRASLLNGGLVDTADASEYLGVWFIYLSRGGAQAGWRASRRGGGWGAGQPGGPWVVSGIFAGLQARFSAGTGSHYRARWLTQW